MFQVDDLGVHYGPVEALSGVNMEIYRNCVTAIIGPSGCGKSTFIRCLNRMNDLVPGIHVSGHLLYHGIDIHGPKVDPVEVRRRIGMVFQRPNPFPKSIYDNVAFAPRMLGMARRASTTGWRRLSAGPPSGTRSTTGSARARSRSRAVSSSACASRARWPSSPR